MAEHHRRLARGGRALAARVRVDLLGPHADAHALAGARLAHDAADAEARGPDRSDLLVAVALERRLEVVHVADEVGDEGRGRPVVDLGGRGELVDPARVHDGDAVGHRHRLLLVVRDHDEGDADVALDPLELDLHGLAQLEVEGAERLVEQQHLRVHDERAGQRDALLHAARELRRLGLLAPGEAHELERLVGLLVALLLADLALLEAVGDVVEHRHVREQRVGLEHGVDVALVRRDADGRAAVDLDLALRRLVEAGDHAQRGRLAAAGRAEQGEELARAHVEIDRVDRDQLPKSLRDAAQLDVRSVPTLHSGATYRTHSRGVQRGQKVWTPWPTGRRADIVGRRWRCASTSLSGFSSPSGGNSAWRPRSRIPTGRAGTTR